MTRDPCFICPARKIFQTTARSKVHLLLSERIPNAYATGIGEWDKVSIRYGYDDFAPSTDERSRLNEMINAAAQKDLIFLTDQDARPPGSAHPRTHLWDNGTDPVQELEHVFDHGRWNTFRNRTSPRALRLRRWKKSWSLCICITGIKSRRWQK